MNITHSKRLSYQMMNNNDAPLLFALDQDPDVMHFINGGKKTTRDEINEVFLPRMKSYTNCDKGWGLWKVSVLESDDFIGWILVRPMHYFSENREDCNLELGWRFMKNSWGKGYASEAAKHIMSALIENKSADEFTAIAVSENQASIAIMKKLGMKFIKKDTHKDPLGDMLVEYYSIKIDS